MFYEHSADIKSREGEKLGVVTLIPGETWMKAQYVGHEKQFRPQVLARMKRGKLSLNDLKLGNFVLVLHSEKLFLFITFGSNFKVFGFLLLSLSKECHFSLGYILPFHGMLHAAKHPFLQSTIEW